MNKYHDDFKVYITLDPHYGYSVNVLSVTRFRCKYFSISAHTKFTLMLLLETAISIWQPRQRHGRSS